MLFIGSIAASKKKKKENQEVYTLKRLSQTWQFHFVDSFTHHSMYITRAHEMSRRSSLRAPANVEVNLREVVHTLAKMTFRFVSPNSHILLHGLTHLLRSRVTRRRTAARTRTTFVVTRDSLLRQR